MIHSRPDIPTSYAYTKKRASTKRCRAKKCITVAFEMEYVVDLLYFKKPIDELVLKEFAIAPMREIHIKPTIHTFEPPCLWNDLPVSYQLLNETIMRLVHGLSWNFGIIPWEDVSATIRNQVNNGAIIYVKGSEKKEWLSKILGESVLVVNVETLECPSLRLLRKKIPGVSVHYPTEFGLYSAAETVDLLRYWLLQIY